MLLTNAIYAMATVCVGIILMDLLMTYLQSPDKWVLRLTNGEILNQYLLVVFSGGLGYFFGWMIGSGMPQSQPSEPIVTGCAFGLIFTVMARGYYMEHIHMKRREQGVKK